MSQSGPEMLLNTLIKLFKLEGPVEQLKSQIIQAAAEGYVDRAKAALARLETFDARLARIERKLGCDEPGSSAGVLDAANGHSAIDPVELRTGTDNL